METAGPGKALAAALWIAQGLLVVFFLVSAWHHGIAYGPDMHHRFVGLLELTGAVGLAAPPLARRSPKLVVAAALLLAAFSLLTLPVLIARGEPEMVAIHAGAGALALFVAWGRRRWLPSTWNLT